MIKSPQNVRELSGKKSRRGKLFIVDVKFGATPVFISIELAYPNILVMLYFIIILLKCMTRLIATWFRVPRSVRHGIMSGNSTVLESGHPDSVLHRKTAIDDFLVMSDHSSTLRDRTKNS